MFVLEHGQFTTSAPIETNLQTMAKRNLFLRDVGHTENGKLAMTVICASV